MTENLAARGEGLAGLAKAILAYDDEFMTVLVRGHAVEQEKADYAWAVIIKQATLLEAAAPAGTAHAVQDFEQLVWRANDLLERAKEAMECDPEAGNVGGDCWTWIKQTEIWLEELNRGAALATPSPQQIFTDAQAKLGTVNSVGAGASRGSLRDERFESAPCRDSDPSIHEAAATQEQPAGSGMHAENCNSVLFNGPMGKCDCRETCQHCGEDLTLLHARNLRCREKKTIYRRSKLPQSFDANDWADEFTAICATKAITIDRDWMVSWFANAIMAGYDHARGGSPRKVGEDGPDDKNYYASYANHCAIQRQIPLTFPAWKRQGKINAPNTKVSSVPVGEQKQEEGV